MAVTIIDETSINAMSNTCGIYGPFEGNERTPKQEEFVQAEMDRFNRTLNEVDAEIQAIEDEVFAHLERELKPGQIQQMRDNEERIAREIEAEIQQQDFENWFQGIELTPEQEKYIVAEIARYNRAFDEMIELAEVEERDFLADAEVQTVEDDFFVRLEPVLSLEQIQQVQDNMQMRDKMECN